MVKFRGSVAHTLMRRYVLEDKMRYIKELEYKTGLDIGDVISVFLVFLTCFYLLANGAKLFPYGYEVFGTNINQHVGELMTEHEAGKSITLLSVLAIFLGLIKSLRGSEFHKGTFDSRVVTPITNFTLCLISTMLAITYAVGFTLKPFPGGESLYLMFLYHGFLKHTLLCLSIGCALVVLNRVADSKIDKLKNIVISSSL
ncbi:hypothetical protein [Vibrio furnissii]|uniref:hypothetical protein n=1 Tax=Vibrio furnissii TaxID=29494 RepID=UPI001EEB62D9|nr:hypothetical protein [Vibrio furnissii]